MKIKEMFKKIIVGIFPFIATISSKAFAIVDIDGGWPPYPYYNTNSTTPNTIFNNQLVSVVLGLCQFILLYIILILGFTIVIRKNKNKKNKSLNVALVIAIIIHVAIDLSLFIFNLLKLISQN